MDGGRQGRLGRGLRRGLAVVAGLALALAAAELVLRAAAPVRLAAADLRWIADPEVGYRLRPNMRVRGGFDAEINSLGLRGPEPGPKSAERRRVLLLGDSMTYGPGVPQGDTFAARLEARSSGRLEVLNAGTPSYGTVRQLAWLRAFGDELEPDGVALMVCLANDVTDGLEHHEQTVVDGRLWRRADAPPAGRRAFLGASLGELHLCRLVAQTFVERAEAAQVDAPPVALVDPAQREQRRRAGERRFRALQAVRLWMYARPEFEEPAIAEAYASQAEALSGIAEWCGERGVELQVALIPDLLAVDWQLFERVLEDSGLPRDQGDLDRPRRAVLDWAQRAGIPSIDLTEPLRASAAAGEEPFQYRDIHLSVRGHELVAQALSGAF